MAPFRFAWLALAAAAPLTACSGPDPDVAAVPALSRPAQPPPATSAGPTAEVQAEQFAQVEHAYRQAWRVIIQAARNGEVSPDQLQTWLSGTQLELVISRLRALQRDGVTVRGTVVLRPAVVSVGRDRALLRDCQDSSGWLRHDSHGRPIGRGRPRNDLVLVTLVKKGDGWKVDTTSMTVDGC